MNEELIRALTDIVPCENILKEESMDKHTTFKVGGPAKYMIMVDNDDQLSAIIKYLNIVEQEYFLLGNGSNLLVSDRGYDGIIIKLSSKYADISVDGNKIHAGAAALLSSVAKISAENELKGMEFAAGIPGSVGGAMIMNAGAFDGEMSMITEEVSVISPQGEATTLSAAMMDFGYRTSAIKESGFVVTGVTFRLEKGCKEDILNLINDLNSRRRDKQPLEYPSAGSTFKRPEGYFAGKLIMDAGLRGFSIGGAKVSDKHCGFVINQGNATAADVYDVISQVQDVVNKKFGVKLEREVILLGDF